MLKHLHIITLNIPYPPDYGGVIDSFYRIKALHKLGVNIHLHCFEYGRKPSDELSNLCRSVYYYPRKTGIGAQLSCLPYVVKSRKSAQLLRNLINDDYPILFDGLHTTYYMEHTALAGRKMMVRAHNIEHKYYQTLALIEPNYLKKAYYSIEAKRLELFEKKLSAANAIFTVSIEDQEYFAHKYGNSKFIPSSHPYNSVTTLSGTGQYILYHGDLSVSENNQVAQLLITEVFSKLTYPCIIAGRKPSKKLLSLAPLHSNITLIENPTHEKMQHLIAHAQVHILPVLENNGLKLKLLLALYGGRHCVVNQPMVEGTYLRDVCHIANSFTEMIGTINSLMNEPFTTEMIEARSKVLNQHYNNNSNAQQMVETICSL